MENGYLVTLGNATIDPGDEVSNGATTTFTPGEVLGTGQVRWAKTTETSNAAATLSGTFVRGDDGNVYFVTSYPPTSFATGGTATVQNFTPAPPPCFTAGTMIATPQGRRPVQMLAVGDLVLTQQGTAAPVLWTGSRTITRDALDKSPNARPIELKLGDGPTRLRLSPQHALQLLPHEPALLVRARQLVKLGLHGARQMNGVREVQYHHILLPRHCLVQANGIWCESFWPGPRARAGLPVHQRAALDRVLAAGYGPQYGRFGTLKELAAHFNAPATGGWHLPPGAIPAGSVHA